MRRHPASPHFWLIAGVFALATGAVFTTSLNAFLDQATEALTLPPAQPLNVNQLLIRPFLVQTGIAALVVLPLVLVQVETFAAMLILYAALLVPSIALVALLFLYGAPEGGPILSGYLGLLLVGAAFLSAAVFIRSIAPSRIAAGIATFLAALLLAAAAWIVHTGTPDAPAILRVLSVSAVLDDFAKGVIDTGHVIACLTILAAGLWLTTRRGLRAATLASAAVAAIVIIVAGTYAWRWDVTAGRAHALAPETRTALRSLEAPARIVLFGRPPEVPARDRLREYEAASRRLSLQVVDVSTDPVFTVARAAGIDLQLGPDAAFIEYEGRVERIDPSSEQEFTNAIVRLREGRTRKIYFVTGHAERDTASTERAGYSSIASALQRENFLVQEINFTQQEDVPADATLVVAAGPRADFYPAEIAALRRYLDKGGALLLMVDPFEDLKRYITDSGNALFMMDPSSASATGELTNLTAFVREHGIDLGNDVIVDNSEMGKYLGTDASVPVAGNYPAHPITEPLTSLSAYPMARSVRLLPGAAHAASIIETSERTWSETDIEQLRGGRFSMDPDKGDRPGPVSLGVALSAPPSAPPVDGARFRETRMVVIGDSDFVANYFGNVPGNVEMFLSTIHWLAQEKIIAIPPRGPQERTLTMGAAGRRNAVWFALLLMPGIALGTAAYLWGNDRP